MIRYKVNPEYDWRRVYIDCTEETPKMPLLRVTPPYLTQENERLFKPADRQPIRDLVRSLTRNRFLVYIGGSSVDNAVFYGKRKYGDLDLLAIYSDKGYNENFLEMLKENSGLFREDFKNANAAYKYWKSIGNKPKKPKGARPITIGLTRFSVRKHKKEGSYLSGAISERFTLRPRVDNLQRRLGRPSDIDLSFLYECCRDFGAQIGIRL